MAHHLGPVSTYLVAVRANVLAGEWKVQSLRLSINWRQSVETAASLPCLQRTSTNPYPEPDKPSLHPSYSPPTYAWLLLWNSVLQALPQNFYEFFCYLVCHMPRPSALIFIITSGTQKSLWGPFRIFLSLLLSWVQLFSISPSLSIPSLCSSVEVKGALVYDACKTTAKLQFSVGWSWRLQTADCMTKSAHRKLSTKHSQSPRNVQLYNNPWQKLHGSICTAVFITKQTTLIQSDTTQVYCKSADQLYIVLHFAACT